MLFSAYKKRPVRFLEWYQVDGWTLKIYSISSKKERIGADQLADAKKQLPHWLKLAQTQTLPTYQLATLILHEWEGGCFAVINWWVDQNMLQHYVYLATVEQPGQFALFSDSGIISCVWESAVLWFERNAWVKHVLLQHKKPNFEAYINEQLNDDF